MTTKADIEKAIEALCKLGDSSSLSDVERNALETEIRQALTDALVQGDAENVTTLRRFLWEHPHPMAEIILREYDEKILVFPPKQRCPETPTQDKIDLGELKKITREFSLNLRGNPHRVSSDFADNDKVILDAFIDHLATIYPHLFKE